MIDKKTIEHIAKLARLQVSDEEAQEYSTQLAKALGHFEQISKVNTAGIEPLVTPTEIESFWREDVVKQEFTAEEMTANAPAKAGNLFKVPPVV
ncbi:glutamyl-tRNA amidotransferase [Bdellovibrio bacteriovorus]|uniref:Aspartyl/glutamyl-tRNA(Asn/Gln) amidotransferase subunit C n=1 Tax=Bdellovibrio bacteriovorus TaxID=959 RepID=A0A150WCR8_BDEBC|nr:Asp-tRNA(Asn)/Glu-tRNA(Gln) amidotransferase subunit GatC [Bdellovibrio bacteriovorus]KYG60776.1 glutamyl-tRNA amidotransferase [Bdellovibrio bacteriovorus]